MDFENLRELFDSWDSDLSGIKALNITDGVVDETYDVSDGFAPCIEDLSEDIEIILDEPVTQIFSVGRCLYVEVK